MRIRRATALALISLALLCSVVPALASVVELTASVPKTHKVTVVCGSNGSVVIGGVSYTGTKTFTVDRFNSFTLTTSPSTNYAFNTVTSNSSTGFTLGTNGATISKVIKDVTLRVYFKYSPSGGTSGTSGTTGTTGTHTETVEEGRLYNAYLGNNGGNPDLFILYDSDDIPSDYEFLLEKHTDDELLASLPSDLPQEELTNALEALRDVLPDTARVISKPDVIDLGDGMTRTAVDELGQPVYGFRSMRMHGGQLTQLEDQGMRRLAVENDEFDVSLSLQELHSGNLAKFIVLAYEKGAELLESMPDIAGLDAMPEVTTWLAPPVDGKKPQLTYEMFMNMMLDIRITPIKFSDVIMASVEGLPEGWDIAPPDGARPSVMPEDGQLNDTERMELSALIPATAAYRARVFLVINDVEFDITEYISSLRASLYAQNLVDIEIAGLRGTDIPSSEMDKMARSMLLQYIGITAIDSDGDIYAVDYVPGMYTRFIETELIDEAEVFAEIMTMLDSMLVEKYDVEILRNIAESAGSMSGLRAEEIYLGDDIEKVSKGCRFVADVPVGGLYLAAESK